MATLPLPITSKQKELSASSSPKSLASPTNVLRAPAPPDQGKAKRWADFTPTPSGQTESTPLSFGKFFSQPSTRRVFGPSASQTQNSGTFRRSDSTTMSPLPDFGPTPDSTPMRATEAGRALFMGAMGPSPGEDLVDITNLPVKNTFIHYVPGEGEGASASTLPPKASSAPANTITEGYATGSQPMPMILQPVQVIMPQPLGSPPRQLMSPQRQMGSPPQQQPSPVGVQQGLASVGAALHGTGECKPCAWFWKPGGCEHGVSCGFCHACPEGEIRRRKKEKVQMIRNKGQGGAPTQVAQVAQGRSNPQQRQVVHAAAQQRGGALMLSQLI